jgi:hypothetical protein
MCEKYGNTYPFSPWIYSSLTLEMMKSTQGGNPDNIGGMEMESEEMVSETPIGQY